MKLAAASGALFGRKSPSLNICYPSSLAIRRFATLTEEESKQINDVVPRLLSSNHLKEAAQLISAALSTVDPPLGSLPVSLLINRLSLEPDLTHSMHLLNSLKYNSSPQNTFIVAKMSVTHSFRNGHPKRALKIFQWMSRPDFPGGGFIDDLEFYAVLVDGLCRHGLILDALGVLRVMAIGNLSIGSDIRKWVYRGLLRDARVKEALEVNAALDGCTLGLTDGGTKDVVDLLDRITADWVD